jgi:phosphate transport system permease protein
MQQPQKKRTPLTLGKKFRFVEWFIESGIRVLAFLSFAAIILIFIFVFKEASPIFFGKSEAEKTAAKDSMASVINAQSKSADTSAGKEKIEKIIKGKGALKGTDITVKVDEKGNRKKVATNGGKVEQEVYDPFADDSAPAKTEEKKPEPEKEKPKVAVIPKIDSAKLLAHQKAIRDSLTLARTTDSLAGLKDKAEADSAIAKEKRDVEERKGATNLGKMLTGTTWQPVSTVPKFGMLPLIIGTLKVTLISLLFGAPLAILAALFTSMFAPKRLREIIKPVIELLAGFPSVVIGFFALIVMASIFQNFFDYQFRLNSFVGGIAMSFAIIPIIYTITEDALTAVPHTLRDASTALGATKWQTAFKIVLPAAIPGVFAAVILGFGRAFGETMIALMATGNAPLTSGNILEPVRTFAATIGAEMAEVVFGDQHYNVLFLIGAMLFIFTFTLNSIVEFYVRKKLLRRLQGQ